MKNRITGSITIGVSVILLWLVRGTFVDAWYFFAEPIERPMEDYLAVFLQPAFYLIAFTLAIMLGLALIREQDQKSSKLKKRAALVVAILLIVLELPVYPCKAFSLSRHSFWFSHRTHFH